MRIVQVVALGAGCALLAWAASFLIPDRYTSRALIRVTAEPFPAADTINHAWQGAVAREGLKSVIRQLNLYPAERERLPLEDVIEAAKRDDLRLEVDAEDIVNVSFTYDDSAGAQAGLQAFMERMVAANREDLQENAGRGRLEVTQAAGPREAISGRAFWRPRRYIARGVLKLERQAYAVDRAAVAKRVDAIKREVLTREHLSSVIAWKNLYPAKTQRGLYREAIDEMSRDLRIEDVGKGVLRISFTYPDAKLAQSIVSRMVTGIVEVDVIASCRKSQGSVKVEPSGPLDRRASLVTDIASLDPIASLEPTFDRILANPVQGAPAAAPPRGDCSTRPSWERADVLEPGSLPEESDGPNRSIIALYGFLAGLGLWTVVGKGNQLK